MTYSRLSILCTILAIVLSSGYAHAQQEKSNADTSNAALREKAFKLLESVAGQLNTLQSTENRARLGANIADSLWTHDEKRARALLSLVAEDIKAGIENLGSTERKDQFTWLVFSKLRVDTIQRIAKYDGELALAFLKETEPTFKKPLPNGLAQNEQGLELQLAKQIAANNPDVAMKLGRKALAQGFSHDLILLVHQLNRKHKEQALVLYKEIVDKLGDKDLADWNTRYFIQTLAQSFKPPAADDATFRRLVALVTESAMAKGCGNPRMSEEDDESGFCRWAALSIANMEKIDDRAAKLKRWIGGAEHFETQPQVVFELEETLREGTIDEILGLATKYPERADHIYYQAAMKARMSGDFEQARKIVNGHVSDPQSRRTLLAQIDAYQQRERVDDQMLEEVQTRANAMERMHERVSYLLAAANRFGAGNKPAALKLLNQVSEILDNMKPGKEQTESWLVLAMLYCLEKNERGFAIMESLVPKLNELVDVAAKLDGYDTQYLRDGEWNMSANGPVGELLTRLAHNASHFAWCDFDRAVSLAAQFERPEIRMMAQVKLAQGILAGPPKRLQTDQRYYYGYR